MDKSSPAPIPTGKAGAFPTTHWSIVTAAGEHQGEEAQVALEELCRSYWYPLYAYVRRRGYDAHAAEDITQDFFAQVLSPGFVSRANRERGRFRSFLLASLGNFLSHERERRQAQKRGGGLAPLSLDAANADERFQLEPRSEGLTPEQAYERSWALHLIERALADLEGEYVASGRTALFARLRGVVWGDGEADHESIAAELAMNVGAVKVSVHRLRKRLKDRLREAVAQTVMNAEETEDELRVLLAALRPGGRAAP